MSSDAIPVLDVSGFMAGDAAATEHAAAELCAAMEDVGFVVLVGHDVDWSLAETAYAEARRFFALPEERKMQIRVGTGLDVPNERLIRERGYVRYSGLPASATDYDDLHAKNCVESLFLNDESRGQNRWPSDLPGFRDAIMAYYTAVNALAQALMPLFARSLSLPDRFFDGWFVRPGHLRLSHYPASTDADEDGWAFLPHTDGNFLTLLPANEIAGLQVRPRGGAWIEAPFIPESFVVNAGDLLMRCSNDRFLSTPHRVTRPKTDRYAMPYFLQVDNDDVVIGPFASCVTPENPSRYDPIALRDLVVVLARDEEERYSKPRVID